MRNKTQFFTVRMAFNIVVAALIYTTLIQNPESAFQFNSTLGLLKSVFAMIAGYAFDDFISCGIANIVVYGVYHPTEPAEVAYEPL